jgi:hypothetical protein
MMHKGTKIYGALDVYHHEFLTSASRLVRFTPGKSTSVTNLIRGWEELRVGLDAIEKIQISATPTPGNETPNPRSSSP